MITDNRPQPRFHSLAVPIATACAISAFAFWVRSDAETALTTPVGCRDLIALTLPAVLRLAPDVPFALYVRELDTIATALVAGGIFWVGRNAWGHALAAFASAAAWTLMPASAPVLGRLPALEVIPILLLWSGGKTRQRLALGAVAALAPGWTPLLAAAAGFTNQNAATPWRIRDVALVAASGLSVVALSDGWAACAPSVGALERAGHTMAATGLSAGPYLVMLGVLGLVARGRPRTLMGLVPLGAAVVASAATAPDSGSTAVAAVLSLGAGAGLSVVARSQSRRVATALAGLLLVLMVLAWRERALERTPDLEHDRLTSAAFRARLQTLPDDAIIVSDDAWTLALLDAARWPSVLPTSPGSLLATVRSDGTPTFVLPRTRGRVQFRGTEFDDVPGAPGFARVKVSGECRRVLDRWRVFETWNDAQALALAPDHANEVGPVFIYATFDAEPAIAPYEWPGPGRRGYYVDVYRVTLPDERRRLLQDMAAESAPADLLTDGVTHVARFELARALSAVDGVMVILGRTPRSVAAMSAERARPRAMTVCPTYPSPIRRFE